MKILVTGASGFVGGHLVAALAKQRHEVLRLTHGPLRAEDPRLFQWDPEKGVLDERALAGVDAVVHLAGESLAGARWSEAAKARIMDSRVKGTRLLLDRLAALPVKPKLFLAASAIGVYGDRGAEELSEESSHGSDFLAQVCQAWESESGRAQELGMRLVQMRFGMVLGADGGALGKMLLPFRLGLGGPVGNGRQYYSWITVDDLVDAMLFFLKNEDTRGVYNCVAPNPVTNAQFTGSLARAVSRPAFLPMPAFAARLAFGEMADAILLASQKVNPLRLKAAGFQWKHPFIGEALNHVVNDAL
jgi:uncharacterized protein (TIGR01777 family)